MTSYPAPLPFLVIGRDSSARFPFWSLESWKVPSPGGKNNKFLNKLETMKGSKFSWNLMDKKNQIMNKFISSYQSDRSLKRYHDHRQHT